MLIVLIDSYVAENDLYAFLLCRIMIVLLQIVNQHHHLAVRRRLCITEDTTAVQSEKTCFMCNTKHIILMRINISVMNPLRPRSKLLHICLLSVIRFCCHNDRRTSFQCRHRQFYHVGSLYICKLLIHLHQLRDIDEFGKSVLHLKSVTRGLDLKLRNDLSECACPIIKGFQSCLLQKIRSQVSLHNVEFYHRIADWRAGAV